MNLYEFEGKTLLERSGILVPRGVVVSTIEEARETSARIGYPVVIKAQVLRGRRGKSGAIRFAEDEASLSREMVALLSTEVDGEKIDRLLIEEKIVKDREFYAGITLDPRQLQPLLIFSGEGGMDIENVSGHCPDRLLVRLLDPLKMPDPEELVDLARLAGLRDEEAFEVASILLKLVRVYFQFEAVTVEVNPLILSKGRVFYAADAKFDIDDSALGRLKEAAAFVRRGKRMDPLEDEARAEGISFVGRPHGEIGLISGGAGLGMATMDMISVHGGRPANFLDLGGNATEEKTAAALRIVLKTEGVKGILINVFGGINNCEKMAKGILRVVDRIHPDPVIVVKMRGHSQKEGWGLLESRGIPIIKLGTTEEAVVLLIEKMMEKGETLSGRTR